MSNICLKALRLPCRTPMIDFKRFRGKINIQRPQKLHYERARMVAVAQPKFIKPKEKPVCFRPAYKENVDQPHPYAEILARELHDRLEYAQMVAFFHLNSISADDLFTVRAQLFKQNMHLKSYGRALVERAVKNTRFENILPIFSSKTCFVYSSEPRLSQLIRITRKIPQMLLLAGIVDNKLLSRNEFVEYAKMPGLQAAQAELAYTLNSAAGTLVRQLEAHQISLVNALDTYAKGDPTTEAKTPNEQITKDETEKA